ncbi:MAG: ribonuclease Z [Brevefilum sp.]|nr:ribonuclease Z [Brevefilum sp.]MDT8381354.1 ribonuclease Z [Brevefilum sp.]MDW7754605.1 ribonuclease Z [Brevefilum sp.]
MFEIVFLGTSASAPSVHRGLSSLMVQHEEFRFLVDCGEGTQRQILRAGVGFKRLNQILLTHGHLDHILGLGGLVSTFLRWEVMDEIEIYGTQHTLDRVHDLIFGVVLRGYYGKPPVTLHEIEPGTFFETEGFTITAFPVDHRGSHSLGYRFEERNRRPFLPEKAEVLNIPPGPWRRDLVNGKTVTLPDGRSIHPDQVLGESRKGTSLVVVGDTGRPDKLVDNIRDADALVIESTYTRAEEDLAQRFDHLTAAQAANLAKEAGVGQLYLTHLSRRYRERDVLDEAQEIFPAVNVARDFDHFKIMREND